MKTQTLAGLLRNTERDDWRLIRGAQLTLLATVLLASLLLVAAQLYFVLSQREAAALRAQVQQTRSAADAAQVAWYSVQQHRSVFESLERHAILGDERRLDWIEAIEALAFAYPALQLQYQFAAQSPLPQSAALNTYQIYASPMQISFIARSENDFSLVYQKLKTLPGRAAPLMCALERATAGLTVQCDFAWLTIAAEKSVGGVQ